MAGFKKILEKYRNISFSERDKGDRFERLMKAYLLTDRKYEAIFKKVWMWNEFPGKADLGGQDTGIDLVALTYTGDYWAIQCKFYAEDTTIDKKAVDTFLSTSGRSFKGEDLKTTQFAQRLWISTSNRWTSNATESLKNQTPPVSRIHMHDLLNAQVDWEKLDNDITGKLARTGEKTPRPHQKDAVEKSHEYFKENDRGKLIMACGTGKTYVSMKIAEKETDGKGLILFLVPSIALLGQTLNEWANDTEKPLNAICICSDPEITKKREQLEDIDTTSVIDLALPASTKVPNIIQQFERLEEYASEGMTVVFSTYQSIEVIATAQRKLAKTHPQFAEFDLIVCDEAHRTTGSKLSMEDESAFTKVHDNDFLKAKKRLYMTATPRLYDSDTKSRAVQAEALLWSMDDPEFYGEEIYRIGFGEAVQRKLLTDYKVLVLTLSEKDVPPSIQKEISTGSGEIKMTDISKLIGCINALSKQVLGDEGLIKTTDPDLMRRAVAFCSTIKNSKEITATYNEVSDVYIDNLPEKGREETVSVSSRHIDGTMTATEREVLMQWLKDEPEENECRVLTNVRCLSEGVDVPSLDAVMFLSAKNSQVDVVQSVGRVMRLSPGKNYGYIIIPVVVPSDIKPEDVLQDNENFKVVWTVLDALRAHDDRFNDIVNKIELNKKRPSKILVGGTEYTFDENGNAVRRGEYSGPAGDLENQLEIEFEQLQSAVFARMVQKVGDRRYWEQWAQSVGDIAARQKERIQNLIEDSPQHAKEFGRFLKGLQKNLNPSIDQEQAVDMLSQHIITKPVFEALFENYSFVQNNPMSQSMQKMLDLLEEQTLEEDLETLDRFYESVRIRASGIDNAEGKQKIIIELYDKFFKTAFPKMVEQLGIVYTPVEVVDFIIHSVADVLKKEFDRSLTDENVHILDPFTGTGTFITRLLQSGRIKPEDLLRKYKHEIHANEIVLLAYYIASVNIENVFHDLAEQYNIPTGGKEIKLKLAEYKDAAEKRDDYGFMPFDGICLTDTFQLGESKTGEKLFDEMFPQNSERVEQQKKTPIKIIIGNPPYSIGQKSANDNAQNLSYPILDKRIADTYADLSTAGLNKSLYDAYIKAFRWSADRLDPENGGILCFVSNGAWLDGNSTDGFRKAIEKEFNSIYVFNLRGNQRTSGELSRKEGGKIFGSGSRTPIAITLMVKDPKIKTEKAEIFYHDIGDYLSREEKLKIIADVKTFQNPSFKLKKLKPNEHGDWINQRNEAFDNFMPLAPVKKFDLKTKSFFNTYAIGVATNRDAWVYNFSKINIETNMEVMIDFYNQQRELLSSIQNPTVDYNQFFDNNPEKISWTRSLKRDAQRNLPHKFLKTEFRETTYRPFCKQYLYFDRPFIESPGISSLFYPDKHIENFVLSVTGISANKNFSSLISDSIPNLDSIEKSQNFPLYYYEEASTVQKGLFDSGDEGKYIRRDGISDFIWERAKKQYGKSVTKEDIFYYVYGFLHSPEYRETFANDLKKMLPRLPLVERVPDFWAFSKAGRQLAELHLNYEKIEPYPSVLPVFSKITRSQMEEGLSGGDMEDIDYKVVKMRFPKRDQKETIIYNEQIIIDNIPAKAYEYVVNGKSAIEWIMDRYQIKTDRKSGITNNPNDWSKEVGDPKYIYNLLLRIINVSVQTVDIVNNLPKVKF